MLYLPSTKTLIFVIVVLLVVLNINNVIV